MGRDGVVEMTDLMSLKGNQLLAVLIRQLWLHRIHVLQMMVSLPLKIKDGVKGKRNSTSRQAPQNQRVQKILVRKDQKR
jgi:hypothetical protein